MRHTASVRFLASVLTVAAMPLLTQQRASAEPITPEMHADDKRLDKPVHPISSASISVNELLAQMAKDTGVDIRLHGSPRGPAEQTVLVVLRDNVTLFQEMNALCSLLSFQHAQWRWTREGKPGSYSYVFWPTGGDAVFRQQVRAEMQAEFEAEDGKLQAALKMTPDQLADAAKNDPYVAQLLPSPTARAEFIESVQRRQRMALGAFFSLPLADRQRAMRGETVSVPFSSLSPQILADLAALQHSRQKDAPPVGNSLSFRLLGGMDISPILIFMYDSAGGGRSGMSMIGNGNTERYWRAKLAGLWWMEGDVASRPDVEAKRLDRPRKPAPPRSDFDYVTGDPYTTDGYIALMRAKTFEKLVRLSDYTGQSVLSVWLPPPPGFRASATSTYDPNSAPDVEGETLKEALEWFAHPTLTFQHKWRDGILLMRDPMAPLREPAPAAPPSASQPAPPLPALAGTAAAAPGG